MVWSSLMISRESKKKMKMSEVDARRPWAGISLELL